MEKQTKSNGKNGRSNGELMDAVSAKVGKDMAKLLDPSAPYGENEPKTRGKKQATEKVAFAVRTPAFSVIEVPVVSTTQLCVHAWGVKGIYQMLALMLDPTAKVKKGDREPKDPIAEFLNSLHPIGGLRKVQPVDERPTKADGKRTWEYGEGPIPFFAEGRFGFPAEGIKKALVSACRDVPTTTMTEANRLLKVIGCDDDQELVEILGVDGKSCRAQMRLDLVRLPGFPPKPDIRFRGFFPAWKMKIKVQYNKDLVKPEDVVNLVQMAGFSIGIGERRPGKSGGSWGTFAVDHKVLGKF